MLIYYDFETTGLNQFHDKVIEYCFIKENQNNEIITSLINPQKDIPEIVTRITSINNKMVENSPLFQNQVGEILEFLNNPSEHTYLVAHNGDNFDFIILREHLTYCGYNLNNMPIKSIDTLLLAKKMYPHLKKHSLSQLCIQLGCGVNNAHRAEADTQMVKNLYHYIINDLANIYGSTPEELLNNPELVYNYINGY